VREGETLRPQPHRDCRGTPCLAITENISVQGILFYLSQVYNQDRYLAWLIELLRACKGAYEMKDEARTKEQLISELAELRQRITQLEALETRHKQTEERIQHLSLVLRAVRNVNQLIVREKGRSELLRGTCKNIVETPNYHNAWIALLDERGRLLTYAEAGLGDDFLPMAECLKQGELPACGQRALRQSEVVVTEDPFPTCTDCPLAKKYEGRAAMTVRLEYGGKICGLLSVSVPAAFTAGVEEQSLFREVAGDISFALRSMEIEEERKRTEETLKESQEDYRDLFENTMNGIIVHELVVDEKGNPVDYILEKMNRAAEETLSWKREDIEGKRATEVYNGDTPFIERYAKVAQTGKAEHFVDYYPGFGRWYEITSFCPQKGHFANVFRDITERKQAERELKEVEERLAGIVDGVAIPAFVVDKGHKVTRWNTALEALSDVKEEQVIGTNKQWLAFYSQERPIMADLIVDGASENEFVKYYQGKHKQSPLIEGAYEAEDFFPALGKGGRWLRFTAAPVKDKAGEVIAAVETLEDITERKQAEELFRTLSESSPVGVYIVQDGKFQFVNSQFQRYTGYSENELLGMESLQLVIPEDRNVVKRNAMNMLKGERSSPYEYKIANKRGKVRWILETVTSVQYGGRQATLGNYMDITERKQAEEALRQSEERYRTILEEMEDSYFEVDLAGNLSFVNDATCHNLGYSREELTGMNYRTFTAVKNAKAVYKAFNQVYRKGKPAKDLLSWDIVRKDGSIGFVEASILPLRDYMGEVIGFRGVGRDVTERKQAEEALRDSEEKFRSIIEQSTDGVILIDEQGKIIVWNQAEEQITGLKRDAVLGQPSWEVMSQLVSEEQRSSELLEQLKAQVLEFYKTGHAPWLNQLYETTIQRLDGTRVNIQEVAFPIKTRKGTMLCSISRDVTEPKRAEEALRRSEEKYRTILKSIEDGYYEVDLAGKFTFFNDAECRQLGYPREEMMGMNYQVYTPKEEAKRVYKAYNQIYRTGKPIKGLSSQAVRKDGTRVFTEDSVSPLQNQEGKIIGFRGVSRDVTERKQMEEALRQSEERYRTILEEMEDSYFEVDLAGNYTFFNDANCRALGCSREELQGASYRAYMTEEDAKAIFKAFNQVYRTGEPNKGFTYEVVRKDGSTGFGEISPSPLRNQEGKIIGFRGVSRDVTERKRMEEERKELERKAQLASRLATVGEMASGVAHEINNPLTGVIGYAQLLMQRQDIPEDIKKDLKVINDGGQRVAGIVSKMLTFARQHKPQRDYVSINDLIANTLALRAYELETHNIEVITHLDPELPGTIADGGQLQQVFLNLIVNAETEMSLAHDKGRLSIKTEKIDNTIRISFKDDGLGIAKENMDKIFNPFFTTREVGQGTGLGLSMCHGIIAEHNGRIYAESKLGKGATFIVELPIVTKPEQLELAEPEVEEAEEAAKARILVVDDEPTVLSLVSRVLTGEGHEVETIDNADDALEMIESKRYHLILLDIKMPGMSGIELYKRIHKIAPSLARRIVFITGDVIGARTTAFLSRTKAHHIMKPFDAEQLKRAVNRILTA